MKKAALHNLGCKVNAYETEAMEELLKRMVLPSLDLMKSLMCMLLIHVQLQI
ncbi:hypothetical protein CIY_17250 [Butyrivibrio fibrisolvens 16/4]|nr:hypothetical protein CIY_17250 [Butyrivibrio fibrisolvens 16/4]